MEKDWERVAQAIDARMRELDLTQTQLAARSGVAPETVRELRKNLKPRRRNRRTLEAISSALGWAPEALNELLIDNADPARGHVSENRIEAEVAELRRAVDALTERVTALERHLSGR